MNTPIVQLASTLEMVDFLKNNGTACRFVSLVCKTPVTKIKASNPFGQIIKSGKVQGECRLWKVAEKRGLINANYNTSVRRRIAERLGVELKEVEYESGESAYQHLTTADGKALPVMVKKSAPDDGIYYLQYFPQKSSHVYMDDKGNVIPDEKVKPHLYAESARPDWKPGVISINIANIHQLKASGIVLEMGDLADEATATFAH